MRALAIGAGALSDSERATLVDIVASKMREACFIDWVVGCVLLAYYGGQLYIGSLDNAELWPAIVALGITRAGNTIQKSVSDLAYWIWHRPGELDNGNQKI